MAYLHAHWAIRQASTIYLILRTIPNIREKFGTFSGVTGSTLAGKYTLVENVPSFVCSKNAEQLSGSREINKSR